MGDRLPSPRMIAIAAQGRAIRIQRLCALLTAANEHDLNQRVRGHEHSKLDTVDCDLERCAVWLEGIAEKAGVLR